MKQSPTWFDVYLVNVKSSGRLFRIFVAFSECPNFKRATECYLDKKLFISEFLGMFWSQLKLLPMLVPSRVAPSCGLLKKVVKKIHTFGIQDSRIWSDRAQRKVEGQWFSIFLRWDKSKIHSGIKPPLKAKTYFLHSVKATQKRSCLKNAFKIHFLGAHGVFTGAKEYVLPTGL